MRPLPLHRQRYPCHYWSKSCGGGHPRSAVRRLPGLARLVIRPSSVPGWISEPGTRGHTVGVSLRHIQSQSSSYLRRQSDKIRNRLWVRLFGSANRRRRVPAFMRVSVTRSSRMVRNLVVYTRRQICVPLKLGTSAGRLSMRCEELRLKICPIAGSSQAGQEGLPPRRPGAVFLPPIRLQSGAHQTQLLGAGGGEAAHHRASRSRSRRRRESGSSIVLVLPRKGLRMTITPRNSRTAQLSSSANFASGRAAGPRLNVHPYPRHISRFRLCNEEQPEAQDSPEEAGSV